MLAKVEISIRAYAGSRGGSNYLGQETSNLIRSWLRNRSIDSIVFDTWQKCWDTEQITMVNLTLWPSTQSWMYDLSPSSKPSTSEPSPPTSAGTPRWLHRLCNMEILPLLVGASVGSL